MSFCAYWSVPIWRGLRVSTIVTATATVAVLIVYLVAGRSWLVRLAGAVITNVGLNVALMIRSLIVRVRLHRPPES